MNDAFTDLTFEGVLAADYPSPLPGLAAMWAEGFQGGLIRCMAAKNLRLRSIVVESAILRLFVNTDYVTMLEANDHGMLVRRIR